MTQARNEYIADLERTLVDLPGLIHATNKSQTEADKELILDLVKEYMTNPRTIILAVISAKNDFANQVILEHCKKIDQQNRRTLGIITKPDYLREGSDNEQSWIDLAQNKDIYLERGWHMLKNRSDDQMDFTFEQRNEAEKLFFSKGRYVDVPRDCVGIDTLRQRLSKLLLSHLIKELPSLKGEIASKLDATMLDIEKLGESRKTIKEQQMVLMKISMRVNDILKSAIKGYYESDFFGAVNMDAAVDSSANIRRFRAVIQHLNLAFAEDMRLRGHKYAVGNGPGDDERDAEEEFKALEKLEKLTLDDVLLSPMPKKLSRNEAVDWVKKTLQRSRGYELPGTFQPMLISQLFWEQSTPWEELASEHIDKVARACKEFVFEVLQHTAPAEFQARLAAINVDSALAKALKKAKKELAKILKDKARHPSTYNHYFTANIQKVRQRKHKKMIQSAQEKVEASSERVYNNIPNGNIHLLKALNDATEKDMDTFSAQDALDTQRAYYKDELKYFVNAVAKAVIERHLVEPLAHTILSPLTVTTMSEREVEFVAAETPEVSQQREFLEIRRAMLEKGLQTFREAMGGLKQ